MNLRSLAVKIRGYPRYANRRYWDLWGKHSVVEAYKYHSSKLSKIAERQARLEKRLEELEKPLGGILEKVGYWPKKAALLAYGSLLANRRNFHQASRNNAVSRVSEVVELAQAGLKELAERRGLGKKIPKPRQLAWLQLVAKYNEAHGLFHGRTKPGNALAYLLNLGDIGFRQRMAMNFRQKPPIDEMPGDSRRLYPKKEWAALQGYANSSYANLLDNLHASLGSEGFQKVVGVESPSEHKFNYAGWSAKHFAQLKQQLEKARASKRRQRGEEKAAKDSSPEEVLAGGA